MKMDYRKRAIDYAARADALKPGQETPERAAIEAQLALVYAQLALVERWDAQAKAALTQRGWEVYCERLGLEE
jgi:hypothetical protein